MKSISTKQLEAKKASGKVVGYGPVAEQKKKPDERNPLMDVIERLERIIARPEPAPIISVQPARVEFPGPWAEVQFTVTRDAEGKISTITATRVQ